MNAVREDSKKWIQSLSAEEKRCFRKYTLNEGDRRLKFYEKLNAMLRGEYPKEDSLVYDANTISNALKRSSINENIICYRGIDNNPILDYAAGDIFSFDQFVSSSVKSNRAFKKTSKNFYIC